MAVPPDSELLSLAVTDNDEEPECDTELLAEDVADSEGEGE